MAAFIDADSFDFRFSVDDPLIRLGPRDMRWNPLMDVAHFSLETSMLAIRSYEEEIYEAWQAKRSHVPVGWTTSWGPFQLLIRGFGFSPIPLEGCAEWFGRYRVTGKLVEAAERAGLSRDVCNFVSGPYGFLLEGHRLDPKELPWRMGFPSPDFVVEANSQCDDQMKVWQNLRHRLVREKATCHTYIVDVPFNVTGGDEDEVAEEIVQYEVEQLNDIIAKIESDTGYQFDEERLTRLIGNANEMARIGREITELRKAVPAPMSFLDAQVCLLDPLLRYLGTERGVKVMRCALEETRTRVRNHVGVVDEEKVRLMWSNTPPWPNMGLFSYWSNQGVVFAFETNSGALRFHRGYQLDASSRERTLETMCRKFLTNMCNSDMRRALEDRKNLAKEYRIDGVVHSSNFGCRPYNLGIMDEIIAIRLASGSSSVPQIIIDQDLTNEQFYDDIMIKNQIQALIDCILEQKGMNS